jgi:galactokinase/mevalonate kinase-like predicted kinase
MVGLVDNMCKALLLNNLDDVGYILDVNWQMKRRLTDSISNPIIDNYYNLAL